MAESPNCIHCRQPVNTMKEDFVVTNKEMVTYQNQYLYAHLKCQQEHGKPTSLVSY
jgi:hypothetical protein